MNLKGIVFITAVVVSTASARADTVFWSITNNSPWQVQVEFENEKGTLQWPGGDKAYTLFDGTEHTYNLSCHTGDRIKYGAWTVADNHETGLHFWGAGRNMDEACTNCVAVCGGGDTPPISLDAPN